MPNPNFDFSGYATKNNIKCTDGRTILPGAFEEMDGVTVPLVWQHMHNEPGNVLGHAILENREDGVYAYGYFNDSEDAEKAKKLVKHGDIKSLSIYANSLVEKAKKVAHGVIRELSLVLSGSNPGALIDNVAIEHADGTVMELEDEAFIYTGEEIELPENEENEEEENEEVISHADDEESDSETVGDVFNSLSDKQKTVVYAIVSQVLGENSSELEQSAIQNQNQEGDPKNIMKRNVFDGSAIQVTNTMPKLSHDVFSQIAERAKKLGSMRAAFEESEEGMEFLAHAGTYGIGSDRTNLGLLFPDAQPVRRGEPDFIARKMEWVSTVINGTRHTPFARIKSVHADITADEARARGYITTNQKVEEVFPVLRRITTPHTVYKKQKLDRDDIIDITEFDVVRWLKAEMRVMLDEELARAFLVGDGRDPVTEVDDHIPVANVRPIWADDAVYVYYSQVAVGLTTDDLIDEIIKMFVNYRGSGTPTMFCAPSLLTNMLLLKDLEGRRLYRSVQELAAELRVKDIVEVPIMEGLNRTPAATQYNLRAIVVNLMDYTVGTDRGGEINFFDDFDIDYNQYKYLMETRLSGALTVPSSALILEQANS